MKKYRIILVVLCIGAAMAIPQFAFANPLPTPPGELFLETILPPILLAILQGIAEFLPISSSGHLVLLNSLFHEDMGMFFDLVLHLATLVSVVLYYRRDIAEIFVGCIRELGSGSKEPTEPTEPAEPTEPTEPAEPSRDPSPSSEPAPAPAKREKKYWKFVGCLAVATAITGVIGLLLNDWVEHELRSAVLVGSLLIVNAGILWISRKKGLFSMTDGALTLKTSIFLGLAQGLAVLPGISRSGTTITVALLLGIAQQDCAKISFLLSIPVILGAVVLHLKDFAQISTNGMGSFIIAAVIAAIVGYVSLVVLNRMLKKAKFHYFAPYCLIVGLIAVVCGLLGDK